MADSRMDASAPGPSRVPADFDPSAWPRKLNLGCGWDHRPGYVNVDFLAAHRPNLVADIRKLGFLPARYYDEIVAQDVLEHVPRTSTGPILAHWNRLLRPGGTLVLRVPNILAIARLLERNEYRDPAQQELLIQFLYGTQAYTGDFHLTSFTEILLRHYLQGAGFKVTSLRPFEVWLFDVTATKVKHIEGAAVIDRRDLCEAGDDTQFLRACYREILQRDLDASGLESFTYALHCGMPREGVIDALLASEEYRTRNPKS
jgi:predicted SAM-dependent methyltransferase